MRIFYRENEMGFRAPSNQITVVYADGYVSAANIIEARIQAFAGYTSRLWDVGFYDANKATLDSDQRVIFLGGPDENSAAAAYAKVFSNQEKAFGCVYSIAGSKALIYPTGEAPDDSLQPDDSTHFYSDSCGNTRSKNSFASLSGIESSSVYQAVAGVFGGGLFNRMLKPKVPTRQEQLETGCEEFMQQRFARWVNFDATRATP
ncbi:hypothetical protein FGA82_19475 [Pseudomonas fluorescens]|uniref:hypothetical protein n=1 Tax=Pseudomonas fluorescens TaxID=294 RepID=UPI0011325A0B|nr:hypothetical protein [Pseudomonas fluorescens]TMU76890.1 hypothetical protein FGA82_19475 [Pseudomonas fluorescens]